MRQDKFSLYRRGAVWYVQFYNPHTQKYFSGRSTGESNRNSALLIVAHPTPFRWIYLTIHLIVS